MLEAEEKFFFLGFRSAVVALGSFLVVSAGKGFLLLIFLLGRGPWMLDAGSRREMFFSGVSLGSCCAKQFLTCKCRERVFALDFPVGTWAVDAGRRR